VIEPESEAFLCWFSDYLIWRSCVRYSVSYLRYRVSIRLISLLASLDYIYHSLTHHYIGNQYSILTPKSNVHQLAPSRFGAQVAAV
jgi:hypothetical protein